MSSSVSSNSVSRCAGDVEANIAMGFDVAEVVDEAAKWLREEDMVDDRAVLVGTIYE